MALSKNFKESIFQKVKSGISEEKDCLTGIKDCKSAVLGEIRDAEKTGKNVRACFRDWHSYYIRVADSEDNSDRFLAAGWELALDTVIREDRELTYSICEKILNEEVEVYTSFVAGVEEAATIALVKLKEYSDQVDCIEDYAECITELMDRYDAKYPRNGDLVECRKFDGIEEMFQNVLAEC